MENRLPEALSEFQQTVALDPGNGTAYANIGFIFFDTGQADASFRYMQKAVGVAPDNAIAHYGLAMIYGKQGKRDLARTHWEKYLQLEPKGYYSRLARKELESLR